MNAKNRLVINTARVISCHDSSSSFCKKPRKSISSPSGANITTVIANNRPISVESMIRISDSSVNTCSCPNAYARMRSISSTKGINPKDISTTLTTTGELIARIRSRLRMGSFLLIKNSNRGTTMKPCPTNRAV